MASDEKGTKCYWPEKTRPGFVLFHHDYRPDGYGLGKPEDQSYFPKPRIEEYLRAILVHPRNFVGLIDQFDETLQFYVNDDGTILIDFIIKERSGSMCKTAPLEECIQLVHGACPSLAELEIPGAVFTPWK